MLGPETTQEERSSVCWEDPSGHPSSIFQRIRLASHMCTSLWIPARLEMIIVCCTTFLCSWLPIGLSWIAKAILDTVISGRRETVPDIRHEHALTMYLLVLTEFGLVCTLLISENLLQLFRERLTSRSSTFFNLSILRKSTRLDLQQFEDTKFFDALTTALKEDASKPAQLYCDFLTLLAYSISFAAYAAILWSFNVNIVGIMLVAAAVPLLAEGFFANGQRRAPKVKKSREAKHMSYLSNVLTSAKYLKEIRTFGVSSALIDRYAGIAEDEFRTEQPRAAKKVWIRSLAAAFSSILFYGCYAAVAISAIQGTHSVGTMTLYLIALRKGRKSLDLAFASTTNILEGQSHIKNLSSFFALAPPASKRYVIPTRPTRQCGILFERVGFKYPGSSHWALKELTFYIPTGQTMAIVGENGAGKSTLIKLLTGLYTPTEGQIWIDGQNISSIPPEKLQERLSVVFQDFNRYEFSVRENIAIGALDRRHDQPSLDTAMGAAGALGLVSRLPDGLDTQLGRLFDNSTEISGGQWQRIALARAFFRTDADILVLDEPFSALDAKAEKLLIERLKTLARNRTAIFITHRFPTARIADQILVLDRGKLVERGRHADLISLGGAYAKLFSLQAYGYT